MQVEIDWEVARSHVYEDEDLLREVVSAYLDECPQLIQGIDRGLESQNAAETCRFFHTIKGSLITLGVTLAPLAQSLENAARASQWDDIRRELPQFRSGLAEIERKLVTFLGQPPART